MNVPPLAGSSADWPAPNAVGGLVTGGYEPTHGRMTGGAVHRVWVAPWSAQQVEPRSWWSASSVTLYVGGHAATGRVCPLCGGDAPRRRVWCTDYCRDLAAICSNPRAARAFVWDRDGGRCAHCPPEDHSWLTPTMIEPPEHRNDLGRFDSPLLPGERWSSVVGGKVERRSERDARIARRYVGPRISAAWQVDHVHELIDGGSHWPGNMQLLCSHHHRVKGAIALAARQAAVAAPSRDVLPGL